MLACTQPGCAVRTAVAASAVTCCPCGSHCRRAPQGGWHSTGFAAVACSSKRPSWAMCNRTPSALEHTNDRSVQTQVTCGVVLNASKGLSVPWDSSHQLSACLIGCLSALPRSQPQLSTLHHAHGGTARRHAHKRLHGFQQRRGLPDCTSSKKQHTPTAWCSACPQGSLAHEGVRQI